MAKITKDKSFSQDKLNTNVVAKNKNLGEIDTSEFNVNKNISKVLNLTPQISNLVNSVLIQREKEKVKQEEFKRDMKNLQKEKLQADVEKGIESSKSGLKPKDVVDIDVRAALTASNNNMHFSESFNEKINNGDFNNLSEVDFREMIKKENQNYLSNLINENKINKEYFQKDSYLLASEMTLDTDSFVKSWKKIKSNEEAFETSNALNSYVNTELFNIKKPSDFLNITKNTRANLKNIGFENLSNKELNESILNNINAMISSAKTEEDLNRLEKIAEGAKIPYDKKNEKINFYSANYSTFKNIENKRREFESKKNQKNAYEIEKIKIRQKNGEFDDLNGVKKLEESLQVAGASENTIGTMKAQQEERIKVAENINNVSLMYSDNKTDYVTIVSRMENDEKIKTANKTFSNNSENPDDLNSENNLYLAINIKKDTGYLPDNYKSAFNVGFKNSLSPESLIVSKAISDAKDFGYNNKEIADLFDVKEEDIIKMEHVAEINGSVSNIEEKRERLEVIDRKGSLLKSNQFEIFVVEKGIDKKFTSDRKDLLKRTGIPKDDPMYEVADKKIKALLKAEYIYSDGDAESSFKKVDKLIQDEFLKIGDTYIIKTAEMKYYEDENYTDIQRNIEYTLDYFEDKYIESRTNNFFTSSLMSITTDLTLKYDNELNKYYIAEGNLPLIATEKDKINLNKQSDTNVTVIDDKFYLDDFKKVPKFNLTDVIEKEYDFGENNNRLMTDYKFAYNKEKLDERFNFLIDERVKTNELIYNVDADDLENANEILNKFIGKTIKERDVRLLNAYSSQIANKKIDKSASEWGKILKK